jgi:hypothetical protein
MTYPQIYLGQTPATAPERLMLRERALDVHAALRTGPGRPDQEPIYLLFNFAAGDASAEQSVELLLLSPGAAIVGAVRAFPGPIEVTPDGRWTDLATGAALRDGRGRTPLQVVRGQRDAVRARLQQEAAPLLASMSDLPTLSRSGLELPSSGTRPFERTVGALICAPATHPESRISLDVDDHRQWLKILGLDELAGLAAMLRAGARLPEDLMHWIAGDLFGGRLWHDGETLLFELAQSRFQLRHLDDGAPIQRVLPLIEGENVVGRRKTPRRYEHRVTISGDDLISSDHVRLICADGSQVRLRDTSKNGTYLLRPDGSEERLRGEERSIGPGALIRIGVTRLRLESAGR